MLMQPIFRERFKEYFELISCLVVKQNNKLLMKIHESRPTRTKSLPETNVVNFNHGQGCGSHSNNPNFIKTT